jgi:hypothetical protein
VNLRSGDLDYACARIAARFGARPDAGAWRRIETVRDLAAMLDAARATLLRPWTAGLSAEANPHAIERVLRGHWRSIAGEVATWMPRRWQRAVEWGATAPDLPALAAWRRGERPPQWFADDPVYSCWRGEAAREARGAAVALAALGPACNAGELAHAWCAEWLRRLPDSHAAEAPQLGRFTQLVERSLGEMRTAPPGDASPIMRSLGERLERLFRHAMLEPTAAFVYLALAALDLGRLRGETMRRLLFPRLAPAP